MFSVGIITAERSIEMIRKIQPVMEESCVVEYLPYLTTGQLGQIYERNIHRFDGVLFSGTFPYAYIVNRVAHVMKPHAYFELTDRDYYKMFASLLYRFPGMDISRVILDRLTTRMDFSDIFGNGGPRFFAVDIGASDRESAYEATMEQALNLWKAGEIDRVVTRFTNLLEAFSRAGIPCELLFPSERSMMETFHGLLGQMQSRALEESTAVVGVVEPPTGISEAERATVRRAIDSFNEVFGMPLVVRENADLLELLTVNDAVKDLTEGYANCLLSGHIAGRTGLAAAVGWGLGRDILDARRNALKALQESRRNPERHAYLVNAEGERFGPLANGRSVVVAASPDARTEKISKALGISSANLQKLINLQEKRGTSRFTSAELAHYLNITPRSANRILIKLAEHGGAQVVQTAQGSMRGRPFKTYEVDYRRLDVESLL